MLQPTIIATSQVGCVHQLLLTVSTEDIAFTSCCDVRSEFSRRRRASVAVVMVNAVDNKSPQQTLLNLMTSTTTTTATTTTTTTATTPFSQHPLPFFCTPRVVPNTSTSTPATHKRQQVVELSSLLSSLSLSLLRRAVAVAVALLQCRQRVRMAADGSLVSSHRPHTAHSAAQHKAAYLAAFSLTHTRMHSLTDHSFIDTVVVYGFRFWKL